MAEQRRRDMSELSYDVVPFKSGWAIVMVPGRNDAFPTRMDAFDAAIGIAHKLRFGGYSVNVNIRDDKAAEVFGRKRAS
jgi:hypothetical protein